MTHGGIGFKVSWVRAEAYTAVNDLIIPTLYATYYNHCMS